MNQTIQTTTREDIEWMIQDARARLADARARIEEATDLLPSETMAEKFTLVFTLIETMTRELVEGLPVEPSYDHGDVVDAFYGEMDEVA